MLQHPGAGFKSNLSAFRIKRYSLILALESNSFSLNTIQGQGKLAGRVTENSNWLAYKLGCINKGIYDLASGEVLQLLLRIRKASARDIYIQA